MNSHTRWTLGAALGTVLTLASAGGASGQADPCYLLDPDLATPELRDAVFEGILLGHRHQDGDESSVFLVRHSWKGVMSDTVSVRILPPAGHNVYRSVPVGNAYLVFGDLDGSDIVSQRCGQFFRLTGEGERLRRLGQPERVLTQGDLRRLNSRAISPGTEVATGEGPHVPVTLSVVGEHGVLSDARVELGHTERRTDVSGVVQWEVLPAGLYEGRVTVGDTVHTFHLLVGCAGVPPQCPEVRGRVRLHPLEPGDAASLIGEDPTFTPFSEAPELLNHDEINQRVRERLPDAKLEVQLGGERSDAWLELFILVGEDGQVSRVRLTRSSGRRDIDSLALEAAKAARFTPARNRDLTVLAWIRGFLVPRQ